MPNNNREAQRKLILYVLSHGSLTTLEAREKLGIMHPGGRISELRKRGHNIITHWTTETDASGQAHRVARYVLMNKRGKNHESKKIGG